MSYFLLDRVFDCIRFQSCELTQSLVKTQLKLLPANYKVSLRGPEMFSFSMFAIFFIFTFFRS